MRSIALRLLLSSFVLQYILTHVAHIPPVRYPPSPQQHVPHSRRNMPAPDGAPSSTNGPTTGQTIRKDLHFCESSNRNSLLCALKNSCTPHHSRSICTKSSNQTQFLTLPRQPPAYTRDPAIARQQNLSGCPKFFLRFAGKSV